MEELPSPHLADLAFRRANQRFRAATTLAMALIGAVVALTLLVVALKWQVMATASLRRLAMAWSPAAFYLSALWSLRAMFDAFARGGPTFQPVVARAMARIGWALLLGAATAFVTALLMPGLGRGHAMGNFASYNLPALTLGVVGMALVAMAHMLRQGLVLQAQATALKATLEEFV